MLHDCRLLHDLHDTEGWSWSCSCMTVHCTCRYCKIGTGMMSLPQSWVCDMGSEQQSESVMHQQSYLYDSNKAADMCSVLLCVHCNLLPVLGLLVAVCNGRCQPPKLDLELADCAL